MNQSAAPAADRQAALNALVLDSLRPATLFLGALYVVFAVVDVLLWRRAGFWTQFASSTITATVLWIFWFALKYWRPPTAWAHPAAAAIAVVIGLRLFIIMFSSHPNSSVTNISLYILVAGCFFLSNWWLGALVAVSLGSWLSVAVRLGFPTAGFVNVYPLIATTVIAFLVQNVRMRSYSNLFELRSADARLQKKLAAAIEKLKLRETWVRQVADTAPVMIGTLDHEGKCTYANQGWLDFIGRRAEDELDFGWITAMHPDDRGRSWRVYRRASIRSEEFRLELRMRRPSGEYRWVLAHGRPWRLPENSDGFIVSAIDIDERKQAESELRASEARLQQIVDNTSSVVFVKDVEGRYLLINRQYEERFHISRDTIRGMTDYELFSREVAEHVRANDRRVVATGELIETEEVVPLDGKPHTYISVKFPLRDAHGQTWGVCGIATDITERKQAEEKIRQLNTELQHASRLSMMGEMAAGLAHEVHQPLAVISNYANGCLLRLQRNAVSGEEIGHCLQEISDEAVRAGTILKGIRGFIRKRETQRRPVDINTLVQEALQLAQLDSHRHRVTIDFEPTEQPRVVADGIQITQVVLNLVLNAIQAMAEQSGQREVRIDVAEAADAEHALEVSVSDTGPGLPPELHQRVFDQFFTTKAEGLGMGLSISKSIIETHEGRLWVTSNAAGGCTFRFTLPTRVPVPADRALAVEANQIVG